MRILGTLLLLAALLGLIIAPAYCQDLEDRLAHSIFKLQLSSAKDQTSGFCTAVVVRPGRALTAAHCADYERVSIAIDGTRSAEVVKANAVLDLAILKFPPHASDIPLPFATVPPKMGHQAAIVGFALGKDELYGQFGYVARSKDRSNMLVLDTHAFHGDSGGAVLNKKLELIGIIVQGDPDGAAEQIFAVSLETIKDFLEGVQ